MIKTFCDGCFAKIPHEPEGREDGCGQVRVFSPDPGEQCSFCEKDATHYAVPITKAKDR